MQNPAFWARIGFLWCLLVFGACWCASSNAATMQSPALPLPALDAPQAGRTAIGVDDTQAKAASRSTVAAGGVAAHAIPALDGLGLFTLVTLLAIAALWLWRGRQ